MSKRLNPIYRLAFAFALILQIFNNSPAQKLDVKIKLSESNAMIEGSFLDAEKPGNVTNISFVKAYAGVENLAARVTDLNLFGQNREKINYKKLADGEFLAEKSFRSWNYRVDLTALPNVNAMAHASVVAAQQAILMTGDLLPEAAEKTSARVTLELPPGWRVSTAEKRLGENVFVVEDAEKGVFYVGKALREREIAAGAAKLNLIISGEWQVADDEAAAMTREIYVFYEKLFGGKSFEKAIVFLGKFPPETSAGRWEAETRGASVTIFSSEMNFKTQSLQRLHEQLRHEIFHLWLPNGVNLSGNYDWFYEGFALYASLKTAVAMNRIRFDDFLDTLSRAHSIDNISRKISLLEASQNRWSGSNTRVYARGLLVGFLIDLALLEKSKGKISLSDVLREIYQKHGFSAAREDGNAAILSVLTARAELRPIVEKYVRGADAIDWQTDLAAIGIESATEKSVTKLKVKDKPSGRQKDLLDKLGYNNWRRNSESSK